MSIIDRALAITSYLFAFGWGIFILLSFIGWGGLINRILFPKDRVDWGQSSAWGMAFTVCVGGVLNLTWTISRTTILIYLGIGFLNWLVELYLNKKSSINYLSLWHDYSRKDKLLTILFLIALLLIFVQYSGWVYSHRFHLFDDELAYLVYPNKMIQTGSLGSDPFSERRLSSLGGQAFLQTLVLSTLHNVNLNLIDPGIALIISLGILLSYLQAKKVDKRILFFLLVIFLLIPYPKSNITSTIAPTALFLSFFTTLDWAKVKSSLFISNACIIALITAAICSLKSTLIPACVLLFISSYFFYILSSGEFRKTAIYEFILSSILVCLLLLPWMISMYQSSGTLLYPILGKGYYGSVYGTYLSPSSDLTFSKAIQIIITTITGIYFIALIVLGFSCLLSRAQIIYERGLIPSLMISAGLGTLVIILSIGGDPNGMDRYPFPFIYPAIFILIINACANQNALDKQKFSASNSLLIAMLVVGLLIGGSDAISQANWKRYSNLLIGNIRVGLSNRPLVSEGEVERYVKMQQSIPESATILTRLEKPFIMNFKRNEIFIADCPGGSSLPPGMPFFKGSEVLADYLVSKSIRYLAYSYAKEAGVPRKTSLGLLKSTLPPWTRTIAKHTLDFQSNLIELNKTRKKTYDDGDIFVLDLLSYQNKK